MIQLEVWMANRPRLAPAQSVMACEELEDVKNEWLTEVYELYNVLAS